MKWILIILFLPLAAFGQETILTGRVWDPVGNAAVEGASVRIYLGTVFGELTAQTDNEGRFVFKSGQILLDIDYAIVIFKDGFHLLNGAVRLNYGEGPDRRFNMYRMKEAEKPIVTIDDAPQEPSLSGAPTNNLIFLIDVSGSMAEQKRLEDLKESLSFLVGLYRPEDRISIITYSTIVEVQLEAGSISRAAEISRIIQGLKPAGKTEGVAGLVKAYDVAFNHYLKGGNNKVILATDGIFGEDKKSRRMVDEAIIRGISRDINLSIFSFGEEASTVSDRLDSWSELGRGHHTHIRTLEEAKEQILREARGE